MNALLIEDNRVIATQITEFLTAHEWQVDYADNAELGLNLATHNTFDVVLLDLNLPDMDGLKVCKAIKQHAPITPAVLMITARDCFTDKAAGFEHGADDYLTKPFDLRELVLRCKALAKRSTLHQSNTLQLEAVILNCTSQTVTIDDQPCVVTSKGFEILTLLIKSYPEGVTRSLILHTLWGDFPPESDPLKSHIYTLRKALTTFHNAPQIKTVMNVGYKLELPSNAQST
ncbi:response regulator transcription factor [Paraglaciecola sp.]|uniref:response regulator transcription factor n=1 Tax=Paraglaciecola sp. TaxID=1920173 RepID=UPI003263F3E3